VLWNILRKNPMRKILITSFVAFLVAAGASWHGKALAADPSVDDLINGLKLDDGKTRGSRPVAPRAETASVMAPTPVVARSEGRSEPAGSMNINILFVSGSAELTPAADQTIGTIGKALKSSELATAKFRIEGHTDTVGDPDRNRALSTRRAESVVAELVSKYGVEPDRLQAVGLGEDELSVPTGDQVPEARNRRVRIVNISH
jgi:outer membrane protein OmpA-like peptidoglycan-associated protein